MFPTWKSSRLHWLASAQVDAPSFHSVAVWWLAIAMPYVWNKDFVGSNAGSSMQEAQQVRYALR